MILLEILTKDLQDYDIKLSHPDILNSINNVQSDSRYCYNGSLFCCLKGINDGHQYIDDAYNNGAVCSLISNSKYIKYDDNNRPKPYILVWNVDEFLIEYAKVARNKYQNYFIAICGSVGKTTLKNFTVQILKNNNTCRVFSTRKSFNFLRSICLEMLMLDNSYNYAVIEVGIDEPDQMREMAIIFRPDYILYAQICFEHMAKFKTLSTIVKEQSKIMDYMNILAIGPKILSEGKHIGFNYIIIDEYNTYIDKNNYSFRNELLSDMELLKSPICETHKIILLSRAIYLAHLVGITVTQQHLDKIFNIHGRGTKIKVNDYTLYDYSYNAGSVSVMANVSSIDTLQEVDFIWGYMVELDNLEISEHQKVIDYFESFSNIRVFLYNIDPTKYIFKNKNQFIVWNDEYIPSLRKHVYIQGSVCNQLHKLVYKIIDWWLIP